jgi:hypothetical protein
MIFLADFLFSEAINKMKHCQNGMMPDHPGSGVSHNISDFLLHDRLIAMYLTVGACRFIFMKRAFVEALLCIIQQFPAGCAEQFI